PPRYSPSFFPLIQTVDAVITPPKSTKTRRPCISMGNRKWRRYTETNSYSLSSNPCHGSILFACGIVTRLKAVSLKPGCVAFGRSFSLNSQLWFSDWARRDDAAARGANANHESIAGEAKPIHPALPATRKRRRSSFFRF